MSRKEDRAKEIIDLANGGSTQDRRIFNIIHAVYRLVVDELEKEKTIVLNDYETICGLLMNLDVTDMSTKQVVNISNLAMNLLRDCEMELMNRGE